MRKHTLFAGICTALLLVIGCAGGETTSGSNDDDEVGADTGHHGEADGTLDPSPDGDPGVDLEDPAPEEKVDDSPVHFDPEVIQTVHVEIDPDDWEELRNQGRTIMDILGEDCMSGSEESPFTWFQADVTVK